MAIPFLNHIDLTKSEIRNVSLHQTTSTAVGNEKFEGQIIYDTGTDSLKYYNGSGWINLDGSGDISKIEITAGNGLTGDVTTTSGDHIQTLAVGDSQGIVASANRLRVDLDDTTIGFSSSDDDAKIKVKDGGIGTTQLGADSVTNAKIGDDQIDSEHYVDGSIDTAHVADAAITFAKMQHVQSPGFVGRTTSGVGDIEAMTVATARTTLNVEDGANNYSLNLSKLNTVTSAMTGDDTITFGDVGDDTTVVVKGNLTVIGTTTTNNVETVSTTNGVIFEGSAADDHEGTLLAGTLTGDRTYTLQDKTGTIAFTDDNTFRTIKVDTDNDGTANETLGSTEDLELIGGTNITLNESGGAVTINAGAATTVGKTNATQRSGSIELKAGGNVSITEDGTTGHYTFASSFTNTQLATAAALIDVSAMGSNTVATFDHGLSSKNLIVQLYQVTTGNVVFADIDHISTDKIAVTFSATPSEDIRVVVVDAKDGLSDSSVVYS